MHRSLQSDLVRIRHAELLNAAREHQAASRLKPDGHPRMPHPLERLQTILTAAGHLVPSAAATARPLRSTV